SCCANWLRLDVRREPARLRAASEHPRLFPEPPRRPPRRLGEPGERGPSADTTAHDAEARHRAWHLSAAQRPTALLTGKTGPWMRRDSSPVTALPEDVRVASSRTRS